MDVGDMVSSPKWVKLLFRGNFSWIHDYV